MRAVGTARRGDVVFLDLTAPDFTQADYRAFVGQAEDLYARTGVQLILTSPQLRPVALVPSRRLRARTGPTPRWMRR